MKLTKKEDTTLEKNIKRIEETLLTEPAASDASKQLVQELDTLYGIKAKEREGTKISKNTMAMIAANLIGIGLILSHEKLNVISTKALGFVLKGRP